MSSAPHPLPASASAPKFLDRFRTALLIRSFAPERTEAHVGWVRAFIHFHQLRHPEALGSGNSGPS